MEEKTNTSPLTRFLASEIDWFNRSISKIRTQLDECLERGRIRGTLYRLGNDVVPEEWHEIADFNGSTVVSRFVNFLRDRYDFYNKWIRDGIVGSRVNVEYVHNLRELLLSYVNEVAFQRSVPI
jgi:hypothetical protein